MKIAIDGPAGSGKSTVAKLLSEHLNYAYIDTGAMYRSIAYLILENQFSLDNQDAITNLVQKTHFEFRENGLYINGLHAEEWIRTNRISNFVSEVASIPFIRYLLSEKQRQIALNTDNVILDGRDIGTVVLPEADLKIYLDTTIEERVRRRWLQLEEKGETIDLTQLRLDVEKRDSMDMNRKVGPLKKAEDAHLVITDGLSVIEVCKIIEELLAEVI